jgi:hypothetical protein
MTSASLSALLLRDNSNHATCFTRHGLNVIHIGHSESGRKRYTMMAVTCFRPIWFGLEAFLLVHVDSPVIVSDLLVGVSRCSWSELASCYVSVPFF